MAWNEPGGSNDKDPWGGGNRGGNDGPPDLDEVYKNLQKKLSGIFGGKGGGNSGKNNSNGPFFALIAIVLVAFYIYLGAGIVNEQEKAVVLRFGVYHQTVGAGFRWNPRFIDNVTTVNVTRVRLWTTSEQMLTEDLNIVDIKLSVQYSIASAKEFVLKVKNPESSLQQATNSALRHVVGGATMDNVLTTGREQVAVQVQTLLQGYLDDYQTGIRIEKVNIEDSSPPREVQSAFDDVIKAREDEERLKNEAQAYANGIVPEARGAAQRAIEEATAYKEQVIAEAEGEAKRFEYLLSEYRKAPKVTRQRLYLDAVQDVMANSSKVMVDVEGGNNLLYLPLDKIVNSTSGSTLSPGLSSADIDQVANQVMDQVRRDISNARRREGR